MRRGSWEITESHGQEAQIEIVIRSGHVLQRYLDGPGDEETRFPRPAAFWLQFGAFIGYGDRI
jgi:hypothetical protein